MSKLVVILGPTASGKSALAMELAEKFNGEIIAADSRTVYRGMDIGTAKPTEAEMSRIPHHLVDIVNPDEPFSAAEFKERVEAAIDDIGQRGKLPILVGGSGLYIDSVIFDYQFPLAAYDPEVRAELEKLSDDELLQKLQKLDPEVYQTIDLKNRRRVVRAIEVAGQAKSKSEQLRPQTLVLGTVVNKNILQNRIVQRAEKMLDEGLIDEVRTVLVKYGFECEAMRAPAYRAFKDVAFGDKKPFEGLADFVHQDLQLAKKQLTWFKRNPHINWLDADDPAKLTIEATKLVSKFLAS